MNRFIRVFMMIFICFIIALIINTVDQLNTPLAGDWFAIQGNWIGAMPYMMFIFLGIFYLLRRK